MAPALFALLTFVGLLVAAATAGYLTAVFSQRMGWSGSTLGESPRDRWLGVVAMLGGVLIYLSGCKVAGPLLGDVLSRLSADEAIACAGRPTIAGKAQCLGVQAMNATLSSALDKAADLAQEAMEAASGQGAEVSIEDQQVLAGELDRALDDLAHEITLAGG